MDTACMIFKYSIELFLKFLKYKQDILRLNCSTHQNACLFGVLRISSLSLKHIYFTLIEKQVLTTYTNFSRFWFLGTTPVLAPNVWANEKSQSSDPLPGLQLRT